MYNEQMYTEWSQLPPNLLVPNSPTIPCLRINFYKIIYLNQINAQSN